MILSLLGCVPLQEGAWHLDYSPVTEDDCRLYEGGQAMADGRAELGWDGPTLVMERDGTDDDLRFERQGGGFERRSTGSQALDASCSLDTEEQSVLHIVTDALFTAETTWTGTLIGACDAFAALSDTCTVRFDWRAECVD